MLFNKSNFEDVLNMENISDQEYQVIAQDLGFKLDQPNLTPDQKQQLLVSLGKHRESIATSVHEL